MIMCGNCRIEMECVKNGVKTDFGHGHVYAGDAFQCNHCGAKIVRTNQEAYFDGEYQFDTYWPVFIGCNGAPKEKQWEFPEHR